MSRLLERHPSQDLLSYVDGELSPRESRAVADHLNSCSQCRAELQGLQDSLAECTGYYRAQAMQMPPAPEPWRDLYHDFARIDRSLANTSLLGRLMSPLVHSGVPRWAFVAGLAGLIVLLTLNQLRQAPSVQAATLLRKAVAVSQTQPRPARRIRVRSSRQPEFTRLSGVQGVAVEAAQARAIAALFQKVNWDWNDPLSARSFEQWRDQQVHKTDEVTAVQNPQVPSEHLTQIRTTSSEGDLEAASITLNTDDYVPVSERLEFRNAEWVELSEIAETSTENAGGSGMSHVEAPVRAAEPPSRPAASAPEVSASISDELQVLSALSGIGADLGELQDVTLADGKVVVSGPGSIPPQRQNEIRASVASLPHVAVEFTSVAPVSVPATSAPATAPTTGAAATPMESRLEKQLGGHAEFDRFSTQLLDLDDAAMKQVYALHNLVQKFSPEQEAKLSPQDLTVLHELSRKHAGALAEKLDGMEKMLAPTLTSLGGTAPTSHPPTHSNWQPAADDVFRSARRVEVLISQVLGMTQASAPANTLPSDLLAAMNELRANLADCQKVLQ
jgi:Putative zinc-finger